MGIMVNLPRVLYNLYCANRRLHWSKEKLRKYQDKRLRQVVRYADRFVPFYHEKFKAAGVDASEIRGVGDLAKLPVIKKAEFKSQDLRRIVSSEYSLDELKKVRTSGSTGTPFQVHINSHEDAWRKAIYMRANIYCGQKPFDRWVVFTSPTHFGDTTGIQRKIGFFAQNCISLFEPTDSKIRQVEAARPDILDGYSGSLFLLAREFKRKGLKTISPKLMFGNAEFIDEDSRRFMEGVFGAPYCDQFGCAEMDRTAWQCLERKGYHLDVDSVVTEFIGEDGEPVSSGERGEVTYTSLFNLSMPFIRYAIGDIGVPSDEACSCGISLPMMEVVEGRQDSFLTLPDERVLSPMVFNFAVSRFRYYDDIEQYQIRQKKTNFFEVKLKMQRFSVDPETMRSEFKNHLKSFLALSEYDMEFDISFVEEIPLSKTGKLMSVWSDLEKRIG